MYILLLTLRAVLADDEVYIPGQLRASDRLVAVGDSVSRLCVCAYF